MPPIIDRAAEVRQGLASIGQSLGGGLAAIGQGLQQRDANIAQQEAIARKEAAAAKAAQFVNSGDYVSAYSTLAEVDPELALKSVPMFSQLDPKFKAQFEAEQERARLGSQQEFGADPRSMELLRQSGRMKEMKAEQPLKEAAAKEKQSDKNASWATTAFGKATASQPFKQYQEFAIRQDTIKNAIANPGAFGDIATIFAFMKTLDPASVVRESEYATARDAGSLFTRAKNAVQKLESGKQLTDRQRSELNQFVNHLGSTYEQNYRNYMKPLYSQAAKRGVAVEDIDPYPKQSPVQTPTTSAPVTAAEEIVVIEYNGKRLKGPRSQASKLPGAKIVE